MEKEKKTGRRKTGKTKRAINTGNAKLKSINTKKTEVKEPATPYLTTRILESALKKAARNLTERAMLVRGYIVTTEKNWVVKKYKDGRVERIKKIQAAKSNRKSGRA
ncbi:MAG: hypothetical protein PHN88_15495 [Ignavibacteria bacterium]|nr:hypothetical protein [Ignavibacteria bacterium]